MLNYPGSFIDSEVRKKDPDWALIEESIVKLGDDINSLNYGDDETLLSSIIYDSEDYGKNILRLTELFLKHGYDVNDNDGKNGAYCLHRLAEVRYDYHLLHISELLIDAGADVSIAMESESPDDVLHEIGFMTGNWDDGDYDYENRYEAYYDQVLARSENRSYKGIRAFDECIGGTIRKIEKLSFDKDTIMEDIASKSSYNGSLVIWIDDKPLIASVYVDFIVDPNKLDAAVNRNDISDEFGDGIIGAKVKGLKFQDSGSARLFVENDKSDKAYIQFFSSRAVGDKKRFVRYSCGDAKNEEVKLIPGMSVERVYLKSGRTWAVHVQRFYEQTIYFKMGNMCVQITSEMLNEENYSLALRKVPSEWIASAARYIVGGPYYLGTMMRSENDEIKLIHLLDDENNNLIFTVNGTSDVWFAKTTTNEDGESVYAPLEFSQ